MKLYKGVQKMVPLWGHPVDPQIHCTGKWFARHSVQCVDVDVDSFLRQHNTDYYYIFI